MSARTRNAAAANGVDMTARIEDAATRLFILRGYNGVSYLDIARELGVTHSSIHYYFRTKDVLAEAVLRRVAEATLDAMKAIWTDTRSSLRDKFVGTRDWMYANYLLSNPGGKGGRPWGLLSRFSLEADALTSAMRRSLRTSFDRLEAHIAAGIHAAVKNGELGSDTPQEGITLQITSLMSVTGQTTRHASGFDRLDKLLQWTYAGIARAYGAGAADAAPWPDLPPPRAEAPTAAPAHALAASTS